MCRMFSYMFSYVFFLAILSLSPEKYSSQYGEVNHFKASATDEKAFPSQVIVIVDVNTNIS